MIPGRFRALPANAQGALWILVGSLFLSANDAVVKTLGTDFHPIQMALFRYAIGMVLLLPWFVKGPAARAGAPNGSARTSRAR